MGIGIMQGRLSPPEKGRFLYFPRDNWRLEFERAAAAGLDTIEWVWDVRSADVNPLGSRHGVEQMRSLSAHHGVEVRSVCAEYFMALPLIRSAADVVADRTAALVQLIEQCAEAEISRIVLPFVDNAKIETDEDARQAATALRTVLPNAEQAGVSLHLETSLAPQPFAKLLDGLKHPLICATYDIGNSASLGYHPAEEFSAYGSRVGSVHVKDRLLGGGTVPLGTGDADFQAVAKALGKTDYRGDFVLEAARGADGDEVAWSSDNRVFIETQIVQAPSL